MPTNTQEGHLLLILQVLSLHTNAAEESLHWVWSVLYATTLPCRLLRRLLYNVIRTGHTPSNDSLITIKQMTQLTRIPPQSPSDISACFNTSTPSKHWVVTDCRKVHHSLSATTEEGVQGRGSDIHTHTPARHSAPRAGLHE